MLATKKKLSLNFLYDTYADKVLGFIIGQNYFQPEAEKLLVKVFVEVWKSIDTFEEKEQNEHLMMLLRIAANFIYEEKNINPVSFVFTKNELNTGHA
ncbi:MAG: hypothetical protein M3015_16055 [Bacteroidota bacterium]|nr:hypothetical protein [Bacteroidota bacterium]